MSNANQPRRPAGTPAGGQWAPTAHDEADVDLPISLDLRRATNLLGPLGPDTRRRVEAVMANPIERTWDDAHEIVLNARTGTTLWQAVCAVDPSFPTTKGDNHWQRIPSKSTLLAAVHYAVLPPTVTCGSDPGSPDGPGSYHHGPHEKTSSCDNPVVLDDTDQEEL